MNGTQDEQDISERLHRLASNVQTGSVEPLSDVRRGRARLRRRNTLALAGSALAVAGVAGGVATLGGGTKDASITPADGSSPSPSLLASVSTPTPTGAGSCAASEPTTLTGSAARALRALEDPLKNPAIWHALSSYATILASHLDPTSQHLQTAPTGFTGGDLPCDPNAPTELGTKLSWKAQGQAGEAMVFVSVTNDWADDQIHLAFDHWAPVTAPPGTTEAWAAADGSAVAVQRPDGTVVAIEADQTFGNDSLVGVAGFGFTADQLLQAAADPRFQLPH